jgi:hypothetical protein
MPPLAARSAAACANRAMCTASCRVDNLRIGTLHCSRSWRREGEPLPELGKLTKGAEMPKVGKLRPASLLAC